MVFRNLERNKITPKRLQNLQTHAKFHGVIIQYHIYRKRKLLEANLREVSAGRTLVQRQLLLMFRIRSLLDLHPRLRQPFFCETWLSFQTSDLHVFFFERAKSEDAKQPRLLKTARRPGRRASWGGNNDVRLSCVRPVIDHEFRHNTVKVAVDNACYDKIHCL